MKKFVVLLVVVAMTCFSAVAFAADVTLGGSYEIRSRDFTNLNVQSSGKDAAIQGDDRDTQNRIRIDVNAKAGDVKGKLQLESDFGTGTYSQNWGHLESYNGKNAGTTNGGKETAVNNNLGFREAWVSFNLPGIPVNVTGGHQLLTLGNGWFYRSMHYGTDAWVVANQTGPNTAAFVNLKAAERDIFAADDIDAYAILDVFKVNDDMTVGVDFTDVKDRKNGLGFSKHPFVRDAAGNFIGFNDPATDLYNLGANFNGKLGPVALKAEVDVQMGKAKNANLVSGITGTSDSGDAKFKGNQVVLQAGLNFDPVGVNVTIARGSGNTAADKDYKGYVTILDIDPHYTFLYEYKIKDAAGGIHEGFSNTTALGGGVTFAATKSLTVGADLWLLRATKAAAINGASQTVNGDTTASGSKDVGTEIDLKVNWKLYDNLAWNWTAGIFKPGDAYKRNATLVNTYTSADDVTGIQGVLAFKF